MHTVLWQGFLPPAERLVGDLDLLVQTLLVVHNGAQALGVAVHTANVRDGLVDGEQAEAIHVAVLDRCKTSRLSTPTRLSFFLLAGHVARSCMTSSTDTRAPV